MKCDRLFNFIFNLTSGGAEELSRSLYTEQGDKDQLLNLGGLVLGNNGNFTDQILELSDDENSEDFNAQRDIGLDSIGRDDFEANLDVSGTFEKTTQLNNVS